MPPPSGWLNLVQVDATVTAKQGACHFWKAARTVANWSYTYVKGDRSCTESMEIEISK
jgi:hypothetical protein